MSEFIVHSIPGSPFGRSVLATLEEKGASYRLCPVAPGALRREPHISRHPFGRVPVLEHDGFLLHETQAILRYLDRILPEPPLTPSEPKIAARMDQVMNVSDWYLFQRVNAVIGFQRIVLPRVLGGTPDETAIANCMPEAHLVMNALGSLLGDRTYFTGDRISLADFLVAPNMDFLAQTPEWPKLTQASPNLVAWSERMESRPSLKATVWERVAAMAADA